MMTELHETGEVCPSQDTMQANYWIKVIRTLMEWFHAYIRSTEEQ